MKAPCTNPVVPHAAKISWKVGPQHLQMLKWTTSSPTFLFGHLDNLSSPIPTQQHPHTSHTLIHNVWTNGHDGGAKPPLDIDAHERYPHLQQHIAQTGRRDSRAPTDPEARWRIPWRVSRHHLPQAVWLKRLN
jgi:hypothetical protein